MTWKQHKPENLKVLELSKEVIKDFRKKEEQTRNRRINTNVFQELEDEKNSKCKTVKH